MQARPLSRDIPLQALDLFHRIRGGHVNVHYFAYYLEYLALHMPEGKLVPALEWLIKNRLTQERFLNFVKEECKRSGLELIRHLTMRVERDKKLRVLTVEDVRT